jgi:hypothetical protein
MYSSRRQERQAVRERALEGALRLLDLVLVEQHPSQVEMRAV